MENSIVVDWLCGTLTPAGYLQGMDSFFREAFIPFFYVLEFTAPHQPFGRTMLRLLHCPIASHGPACANVMGFYGAG